MYEVEIMEERRELLIQTYCLGFCPKCVARGIKSRLVDFYALPKTSAIKNFCQQCREAWPAKRVMRYLFFEGITDHDIIRFLIHGGKTPEEIFKAIRHP